MSFDSGRLPTIVAETRTPRENLLAEQRQIGALLVAVVLGNFWYAGGFGLYEDDWMFLDVPFRETWSRYDLLSPFTSWPQGRPVGAFLSALYGHLAVSLGGIQTAYFLAAVLLAANTVLLYGLMRRCLGSTAAFLAAAFYALSPLDTTRAFITHAMLIQMSALLMLLGSHLFMRGRLISGYAVAALSLLTYESPFFPFIALPLLSDPPRDRTSLIRFGRHLLICGMLTLLYLVIRSHLNEERLAVMESTQGFAVRWMRSIIFYTLSSFAVFYHAAVLAWVWPSLDQMVLSAGFGIFTYRLLRRSAADTRPVVAGSGALGFLRAAVTIFAFIVLGHITSFFHYPLFVLAGRASRVYSASVMGFGLLFALSAVGAADRLRGGPWWRVPALAAAAILATCAGYGIVIQKQYYAAWDEEKRFLSQTVALIGDAQPGDIVLFQASQVDFNAAILTHSWGYQHALDAMFRLPGSPQAGSAGWEPIILTAQDDRWRPLLIRGTDGLIHWSSDPGIMANDVLVKRGFRPGSLIVLEETADGVRRRMAPLEVDGVQVLRLPSTPAPGEPFLRRAKPTPLAAVVLGARADWFPVGGPRDQLRPAPDMAWDPPLLAPIRVRIDRPPAADQAYTLRFTLAVALGAEIVADRYPGQIGPVSLWQSGGRLWITAGGLRISVDADPGRIHSVTFSSGQGRSWLSVDGVPMAEGAALSFGDGRIELGGDLAGASWQGGFQRVSVVRGIRLHDQSIAEWDVPPSDVLLDVTPTSL